MITRDEFIKVIDQTAEKYHLVAALRKAGDPRYFQQQEAMATMFAMLSQQVEVGMMEPFDKVRDATVLADAALKGVIPKASPARVKLLVKNTGSAAFVMAAGRRVTDSDGLIYEVDKPVTIPAAASATVPGQAYIEAVQRTIRTILHTVTDPDGFYSIEIPASEDGRLLASIQVKDSAGVEFRYSPGFTNVWPGDKVYHVEMDEYQRVMVKFGLGGTVGYQPIAGDKFTLILTECNGDVRPAQGSPFTLEYTYTLADTSITMEMFELVLAGASPLTLPEIRELCRYPSTYNASAVYLGEFDFLVRRTVTNLRFLSVWNEQIEEKVRGANVDNINRLFVSVKEATGANHAATFEEIKRIMLNADDSYDVKDVPVVENPFVVTIKAQVARVHDLAAVTQQIRQAVLSEYGRDSLMARRGMVVLQFKRVYEHLRSKVAALQDAGSDFSVTIAPSAVAVLPEHWRFVSETSLTVDVVSADYSVENWGV